MHLADLIQELLLVLHELRAGKVGENTAWCYAYQAMLGITFDCAEKATDPGQGLSALAQGRKTITATASTADKLDWLKSIPSGATHIVNYKTQNFAEEVKKMTNGNGVDVIIDFVGQSHWQKNIDALARDGRMTMLGLLSGGKVDSFDLGPLLYKRLRIEGSTLRSRSPEYTADLIESVVDAGKSPCYGSPRMGGEAHSTAHDLFWCVAANTIRQMDKVRGSIGIFTLSRPRIGAVATVRPLVVLLVGCEID
ncbi:hypothetical protein POSPLADRAFT_1161680 [Postia placenta MAD-698-R-SB12]|uniref:Alcohol dehydrogenase-like C-terminal domain-containing protein n=1 Tax=Postia placenta MAD-698-R-SB12 TaxID=670580 RepID=A0A1X6MIW1_9APHY|nr:hypothetical protein POSPLADRAFT_1161680 [Postia placenta MAD-698-R-SB12]OSX55993.1 hypothetical protein POSPLADRAFT_1161680 [Postia placenta MAD-698-R-SB12]